MRHLFDHLVSKCVFTDFNAEKIPAERQRLIYSGRVMKDPDQLSTYRIKEGNTIHMVKSAPSNAQQNPASANTPAASGAPRAAAGVPQNMAAGTANNPLAGLTGARYAGHMGLPGMEMFGADGGMGAPPSEDQLAEMLDNPNMQQMMNEALSNPAMVDMIIQNTPHLRNNPHARQMLNSPEFRQMMTNPAIFRQSQQMRRMMQGAGGAGGGFPAPGVTDTTPAGTAGSNATNQPGATPFNPFAAMGPGAFGGGAAGNPFAAMFGQPSGQTPAQTPPPAPGSAGQGTPSQASPPAVDANAANPFAAMFGGGNGAAGGANPFGLPPMTPEMMQQAMQMFGNGGAGGGFGDLFGAGGAGAGATSPPAPADTRPPEERYADQLRQLNDMGFFDFDRNVEALRRSGGSVQGAIEQLLS
jgi:ubiquilin